ncbi:hypothetical protein B0J12DRAFT_402882 [Macrophomina phaseolina]|uniref:Zn(2)-C6 fungal-type domain-containing protein n=1 Tax=Macrophomina phaseolina TaxID=35725 RepID=A0ABQ8GIF9_9PEZI|nr:hypothetical protein B0J12DRAFT_402882 [Macrophomina phaseolina]
MPPRPRKGHRKSRTGCANCKRRKIKCDESRPECGNCVKHRIRCDYLDAEPHASPQSASASPAAAACGSTTSPQGDRVMLGADDHHHHHPHAPPPIDPRFSSSSSSGGGGGGDAQNDASNTNGLDAAKQLPLNVVDLELMYNFITSTSHTMSSIPEVRNLWRLEVPRIAFRHEFVLRAMLAVSALHVAQWKSDPDERDFYLARALAQHRLSLREPMALLHNLTPENGAAVFVFASLTAVFSLAMPRAPDDFLIVGDEGITNWLFLLRGVASVGKETHEWLLADNIAGMVRQANVPLLDDELLAEEGPPPVEDEQLMNLRRFLQRDVADPEELRVYLEATDKLSRAFAYFGRSGSTADQELRSIFVWIYRTPDEYLALLTQYKPHALLIFGFYSALLHRLNSVWWVKGRGTHLISLIYRQLDPYYRSLLRWPIEEIGWVPT